VPVVQFLVQGEGLLAVVERFLVMIEEGLTVADPVESGRVQPGAWTTRLAQRKGLPRVLEAVVVVTSPGQDPGEFMVSAGSGRVVVQPVGELKGRSTSLRRGRWSGPPTRPSPET
jgi:hypothetical protein